MALAALARLIHLIYWLSFLERRGRVPHIGVFEGFGSSGFAIGAKASIGGSEMVIGLPSWIFVVDGIVGIGEGFFFPMDGPICVPGENGAVVIIDSSE